MRSSKNESLVDHHRISDPTCLPLVGEGNTGHVVANPQEFLASLDPTVLPLFVRHREMSDNILGVNEGHPDAELTMITRPSTSALKSKECGFVPRHLVLQADNEIVCLEDDGG